MSETEENMRELLCLLAETRDIEVRLSKIRQGLPAMDVTALEQTLARIMAEGIGTYHQIDDILDQG